MPAKPKKRTRTLGEEPALGLSSHMNIKLREEIIKRLQERRKKPNEYLWDEVEKEVIEELKKKYRQK
jgi:hypothetical protein